MAMTELIGWSTEELAQELRNRGNLVYVFGLADMLEWADWYMYLQGVEWTALFGSYEEYRDSLAGLVNTFDRFEDFICETHYEETMNSIREWFEENSKEA